MRNVTAQMVDPLPLRNAPSAPAFSRRSNDSRQKWNQFFPKRLMKLIGECAAEIFVIAARQTLR